MLLNIGFFRAPGRRAEPTPPRGPSRDTPRLPPRSSGTSDASFGRVNTTLFGLKRAYWGSLGMTRRRLKEMGLTAARFDLLYVLRQRRGPVGQRHIVRILGVTHPVVSRMLKSLRTLGLTSRERRPADRREWMISLTPAGRALIDKASFEFIFRRRAARIVEAGVCPNMPPDDNRAIEAVFRVSALDGMLDNLRYAFCAGGTLYDRYRWIPRE
jgi:DNA-binding MarR family transcriptional regulator